MRERLTGPVTQTPAVAATEALHQNSSRPVGNLHVRRCRASHVGVGLVRVLHTVLWAARVPVVEKQVQWQNACVRVRGVESKFLRTFEAPCGILVSSNPSLEHMCTA